MIIVIGVAVVLLAIAIGLAIYFLKGTGSTAEEESLINGTAGTTGTATSGGSSAVAAAALPVTIVPDTSSVGTVQQPAGYPSLVPSVLSTPWNDEGGGNLIYLDRHDVACPSKAGMSQFHYARKGDGNFR